MQSRAAENYLINRAFMEALLGGQSGHGFRAN